MAQSSVDAPQPMKINTHENREHTEALTDLRRVSEEISRIAPGDAGARGQILQAIAELIERALPGSSVVIDAQENDAAAEPRAAKSALSYPLRAAHEVVGVLSVYFPASRELAEFETLVLENFVNLAALAIERTCPVRSERDRHQTENELHRLRRAGILISSRLRLEETLESILQLALEITNAQYGIFRLLDKSGESLVTSAVHGVNLERPLVEKLPLNGTSIMAHVARTREPVLVSDLRLEPWSKIYYPLDSKLEMRSELAVPLINASGRLEGVLNLESPRVRAFSEDDNHMLQSLAAHATTAIQEVRLLDALQEIAQRLVSQPRQQVLDHLSTVANELLNSEACAIWLRTDSVLTRVAADGALAALERIQADAGPIGRAVVTKQMVHADHESIGDYFAEADKDPAWERALIAPLLSGEAGAAIGAFGVFSRESSRFIESEWDEKILTCLAQYAVLAVQSEAHQVALRTSQEQHLIAETFAAVGDISANLLHNMNNKVGTIPVRVQSIQDKYAALLSDEPYLANILQEIEHSAMQAMQIVQDNLSHLRPIRIEQVDAAARIDDAIQAANPPPTVSIETRDLRQLPRVLAGGQSLTFVFKNLIDNAVEAMHGAGLIVIAGAVSGAMVEIIVRDSGPGISAELHDKIFELDYSGRAPRSPGKLGFGLWWVKTLMTRLGGSVLVDSDGVHGTTLRLQLPRADAPQ